jgi:hypothetical protein
MVQLWLERLQTDFDVAQTGSISQLSESHAEKLIEAGEPARAIIATILADAAIEISLRKEGHELGEHELSRVHCQVLSACWRGKDYQKSDGQVEIDAGKKAPYRVPGLYF